MKSIFRPARVPAVAAVAGGVLAAAAMAAVAADLPNIVLLMGASTDDPLRAAFADPPAGFKTRPLWHLNGQLTPEGIAAQLGQAHTASGFGGVAILPVTETRPQYLSEEYFQRYGEILETCRSLGMEAIFYDDVNYPSGTAGGRLARMFPEHTACRLDLLENEVTGPHLWQADLPAGVFMGAVAINPAGQRHDISAAARDGGISWQVPDGAWTVMVFTCERTNRFVDYLCPESVEKFISLTYDEYHKRFASHFGSTIRMTFFDDVGVRAAERRSWTPEFNRKFEARHGFSPVPLYPALWRDIGPDTEAARVALFGFRAELLSESYPRKIHEWAAARGLKSSGHAMGQYHPQPSFLGGDHMLFYRHSDVPMIDSIHYYGHGRPGFKLTSSAACCYDRPLTAVEIYGNYRSFDPPMLYRSGMELFARGANLLLPHGMWYDSRRVRIKPLISHFDPQVGPELARFNEWAGRCSLLLQGGRHVADIGMLYPVAAMHAHARLNAVVDQPQAAGNLHPGLYVPPQTDLNELSDRLTGELRRDFTFLHPRVLDDQCTLHGPVMRLDNAVNFEDYRVLVLPSARVVHATNLSKLRAFCEAGGRVIVTTQLPAKSAEFGRDAEVAGALRALFGPAPDRADDAGPYRKHTHPSGGAAYFVPAPSGAALGAALDDALPVPDVRFAEHGPPVARCEPVQSTSGKTADRGEPVQGMLSYLHKVKDGREIFFFANSTDQAVDTEVTLRGRHALEAWDPHDGTTAPAECESRQDHGHHVTRVRLRLDPVRSLFLVGAATDGATPNPATPPSRIP